MSEPWEYKKKKYEPETHVDLTARVIVGVGLIFSMCLVSTVESARAAKKLIKSILTR
jgi:hypothetical protein